tara:strand:- start:781 stop:954 length:174 start_codon:yes stop_codon:yes gene_type:complete
LIEGEKFIAAEGNQYSSYPVTLTKEKTLNPQNLKSRLDLLGVSARHDLKAAIQKSRF